MKILNLFARHLSDCPLDVFCPRNQWNLVIGAPDFAMDFIHAGLKRDLIENPIKAASVRDVKGHGAQLFNQSPIPAASASQS